MVLTPFFARSPLVKTYVSLAAAHAVVDGFGNVWPIFKKLAGLDLAWAGIMAMVAVMVASAAQPLFGAMADRGLRRRFVILGTSLVCLNALLGPISLFPHFMHHWSGYLTMFGVLLAAQFGLSLFHPPAVAIAGEMSTGRTSTLIALFLTCGFIGIGSSHLIFSTVYAVCHKHTEVLIIGGLLVVAWAAVWCRPAESKISDRPEGRLLSRLASLPKRIIFLWLIQVCHFAAGSGIVFLMPEFIQERFGDQTEAQQFWVNGGAMAVWMAGSVVMMVPVGHLADRYGRRFLLMLFMPLAAASFYFVVSGPALAMPGFLGLVFLTGGLLGAANPLCLSLGQQLAPGNRSLVSGLLMGFAWSVASVANAVGGHLAKQPHIGVAGALAYLGMGLIAAVLFGGLLLCIREPSDEGRIHRR